MGQTTRKKFSSNSFSEKRSTEALKVEREGEKKSGKIKRILRAEKTKIISSDDEAEEQEKTKMLT